VVGAARGEVAGDVTGGEEGRGREVLRWQVAVLAGLVGLAVVGCAPQVGTVATLAPTPAPSFTPTSLPARTATATFAPTPVPTPAATSGIASTEGVDTVTFTVVYDNNAYDPALQTAWGFACLVETGEATVLFDTGGDGPTLLSNMTRLGIDPHSIDAVVLSHIHGDHTGGLAGLLDAGARPVVYVPATFPASFKDGVRARTGLMEVVESLEILPGVYTTGEVGSGIVEQALVVETGDGLVVVTGCAHPGVVEMVRRAKEAVEGEVALVMGGFHLGGASRSQIENIIAEFRRLGVQRVAPCHCTGDLAREMFAGAFGADFFSAGVGWVTTIGSREEEAE
jgi:7,8-dihydropterin-6-yl-methyl-4-(beta-D-ribofuranosyl)aminobenzene 5'-phosphate synthase